VFFTATKKTNYQSSKFLVILGRAKAELKASMELIPTNVVKIYYPPEKL